jgi:D-serine deaminase-like pyridoxal phosphate-dependent protein
MFPEYDVLITVLLTASGEQFGLGGSHGVMRRQDLIHPRDLQEGKHLRLGPTQCEITTP